jgi:phospholipid/cholesterol/gamma-HCH transport system substrate-binding protein
MSTLRAGIIALSLLVVLSYFGLTKANPFANPYELRAVFDNASNLKPRSPVRIAGVDVGKVVKVEPITGGEQSAEVTMELKDKALPIHRDAQLKIRSRIFLEGNFFVDIRPGSPSAPELADGATIPIQQTAGPVQFGQLLSVLQHDTREDLQTFLREYSKGLSGKGARGFNRSIRYWEGAYRSSSLANDATLGQDPDRDIQRVLRGQARTFRALARDEQSLKDLVTDFNTTAAAFAAEDAALERSVPALRDVVVRGRPALASLDAALPTLRAFARDALPGVRSSKPTLDQAIPFIRQARKLVSPAELRGAARELRRAVPHLVRLNHGTVAFLAQARTLSACTSDVLVPFVADRIPDPDFPENSGQTVNQQIQRGLVGLAGESRQRDANSSLFNTQGVPPPKLTKVRPARPSNGGVTPPSHRPDVPCETQERPDLNAPGGAIDDPSVSSLPGPVLDALPPTRRDPAARARLRRLITQARAVEKRSQRR